MGLLLSCLDPKAPLLPGLRLTNDDLDITAKTRQQSQKTFDGVVAELPPQEPGYVGLGYPQNLCDPGLCQPMVPNDLINLANKRCLQQMRFRIRPSEISKHIVTAMINIGVVGIAYHHVTPV